MAENDAREKFVTAFAGYLRSWVAAAVREPGKGVLKSLAMNRGAMLKAFSAFLVAEGVAMDEVQHYELLARMTSLSVQLPPSVPAR